MLHIHSGEAAAEVHRRASSADRLLVWKDSPAVGPWNGDRAICRRLRSAWWGVPEAGIQGPEALEAHLGEEAWALWFGPDPWEQMALVQILALAAHAKSRPVLYLVPLDRSVARMDPDDLAPALARRQVVGPEVLMAAASLWQRFLTRDWAGLVQHGQGIAALPYLSHALARLAEDHPPSGPGRTERQVRGLMAEGIRELGEIMSALRGMEEPRHGAWYGDAVVRKLMGAPPPG
ncbi:MAG TPA: hypothetical protein VJ600_02750 [Holophagaceae bacterium]|nr:hypothetical protein [Holophagaceae bacterium]